MERNPHECHRLYVYTLNLLFEILSVPLPPSQEHHFAFGPPVYATTFTQPCLLVNILHLPIKRYMYYRQPNHMEAQIIYSSALATFP